MNDSVECEDDVLMIDCVMKLGEEKRRKEEVR